MLCKICGDLFDRVEFVAIIDSKQVQIRRDDYMKTLFYGGTILTMEDPLYAEALLVENGVIQAVGTEKELRAMAGDCEEVNLEGAALLPGFIDSHSHFFEVADSLLKVSLDGVQTAGEIKARIRAFIETNHIQPGQWVNARDYDNNQMVDLKNPTMDELNTFAPDNPLIIHHKSGHMGFMNELALNELGITVDTPSPEGGRIEQKDGKLTGYLEENAFIEYIKKAPMADVQQLMQAFVQAQEKYASYGITTLQDGMVVEQMLPLYQILVQKHLLQLDVKLFADLAAYDQAVSLFGREPSENHVQTAGLKIFLDGSPQGRTAWMRQPYEGEETYCGYGTKTDEAVKDAFRMAAKKHTQLICHCNGDGAAAQFLRCLKEVEQEYPELKELRPVLIHGQLMGVDQLPQAAELGAMVSFFVAHTYHWGDVHLRNFGKARADRISPTASALQAGVKFTFHQDAPVIEPDMIETLWCAVNRVTKNGVELSKEERLTTLEALRAITINGAYQYFEEDKKGSLAPGKLADLVVLDRDPLETPAEDLRSVRVMKTYKNGNCVYTASH